MQVIGSVFGGKRDEKFWEWRKQAQAGGISSLNSELTYGEFDLDLFGKLLALAGEKSCAETEASSQSTIELLVVGERNAASRSSGHGDVTTGFHHRMFPPSPHPGYVFTNADPAPGEVFLDVGSGCGRLVIFAAIAFPSLSQCRGIEVMPRLHEAA